MLKKGEKVAIWGTGSVAVKVYYLYCNQYDVTCFYDNGSNKWGTEFYGILVKNKKENRI